MSAPAASFPEPTPTRSRVEINRANARHSTGPRTPDGKARASMNALKHGLFSREVVLPGEDSEAFDDLGRSLAAQFHAETEEELNLVQEIADSRWRTRRAVGRETAMLVLTTEQQRANMERMFDADPDTIAALAEAAGFQANLRLFTQLFTAEARLYRRAELAEKKLAVLVKGRRSVTPVAYEPVETAASPPPPLPDDTPAADSGFVPSDSANPAVPPNMPHFSGPLKKENRRAWLRKHRCDGAQ